MVMGCTAHLCNFICIGGGVEYRQQGYTFAEQGFSDALESDGDVIGPVDGKYCLGAEGLGSDGILSWVKICSGLMM